MLLLAGCTGLGKQNQDLQAWTLEVPDARDDVKHAEGYSSTGSVDILRVAITERIGGVEFVLHLREAAGEERHKYRCALAPANGEAGVRSFGTSYSGAGKDALLQGNTVTFRISADDLGSLRNDDAIISCMAAWNQWFNPVTLRDEVDPVVFSWRILGSGVPGKPGPVGPFWRQTHVAHDSCCDVTYSANAAGETEPNQDVPGADLRSAYLWQDNEGIFIRLDLYGGHRDGAELRILPVREDDDGLISGEILYSFDEDRARLADEEVTVVESSDSGVTLHLTWNQARIENDGPTVRFETHIFVPKGSNELYADSLKTPWYAPVRP